MPSTSISEQAPQPPRAWTPLELAEVKTPRRIGRISQAKGASARRRIKFTDRSACYHVMSRTVNGEFLFGDLEKEAFRRMMWRMATFTGIEILTYAVMDNHFHILAKVPDRVKWLRRFQGPEGEARLLKHLATVYSEKFLTQLTHEIATFRQQGNETAVTVLLDRFKKRFCDISLFVKELKERFSRWFNKHHNRRGTLWMDRFQSILVDGPAALATMAAYIDLNPVRAGLVNDPKDFPWSGYGEASAGSRRAKRGLSKALGHPQDLWDSKTLPRYRLFLYDEGLIIPDPHRPQAKSRQGLTPEARNQVQSEGGELQKRNATFTRGIAIGRKTFIREIAQKYQSEHARTRLHRPKKQGTLAKYFALRERS